MVKNVFPILIACGLGLIAIFAVSRVMRNSAHGEDERPMVTIVAAAKDILPGDGEVKESWLMPREVDAGSCPAKAVRWSELQRVVGQRTQRSIARGDYVLSSDVQAIDIRLDAAVGEGEWAVPVTFSDPTLTQFLQPGMEIAILATRLAQEEVRGKDATAEPEVVERRVTSVLFPCVKILDVGKGDATRRSEDFGNKGIVVLSVSPQQAAILVAAQRTMELYPALRRTDDVGAAMRRDVGIVTDTTFKALEENLETVKLPDGSAIRK